MSLQTLWILLFVCVTAIFYSYSERNWNLLTVAIVLAFCSGLAIYFKLLGGAPIL